MSSTEKTGTETYVVGKRDFNSFFVTVCRQGDALLRQEGFKTIEQARAWIRDRNKTFSQMSPDTAQRMS